MYSHVSCLHGYTYGLFQRKYGLLPPNFRKHVIVHLYDNRHNHGWLINCVSYNVPGIWWRHRYRWRAAKFSHLVDALSLLRWERSLTCHIFLETGPPLQFKNFRLIDWLDEFYAVSLIFKPCDGGMISEQWHSKSAKSRQILPFIKYMYTSLQTGIKIKVTPRVDKNYIRILNSWHLRHYYEYQY